MMKSWRLVLLLILVLGMFGCHRRLKEFAREAEAVTVQVNVSGRPSVDLVEEGPAPDNLAGAMGQAAVNVAATKKSIDTQRRIERLIAPEHILGLTLWFGTFVGCVLKKRVYIYTVKVKR